MLIYRDRHQKVRLKLSPKGLIWLPHSDLSSNKFEILTTGTVKLLQVGQSVVIYRDDSSITLGCTASDPCRLTIMGEQ